MTEHENASLRTRSRSRRLAILGLALASCVVVVGASVMLYRALVAKAEAAKENALQELATLFRAEEIDYGFHVIDGKVVFEGRNDTRSFMREKVLTPVRGADPKTFRTFDQQFEDREHQVYYGADATNVFVNSVGPIHTLNADPATFRLLDKDGRFACDDSNVFFLGIEIEGADSASFKRLSGDFSVDNYHAFIGHRALPADAATFEALSPGYIYSYCIWRNGKLSEDTGGLEGWNLDAHHVYYGNKRIEEADVDTFQYLQYLYAKDANRVYHGGEIIEEADPETFEILGTMYLNYFPQSMEHPMGHGPMARDANHFYLRNWICTREGPWSESATDSDTP